MKKENLYKFLYLVSIVLIIVFAIILVIDYKNYDAITNSAPFSADIIVRGLEFVLPSFIIFIIGLVCKKKYSK